MYDIRYKDGCVCGNHERECSCSELELDLSRGFDAGNYAAAYETTDYSQAIARLSMNRSPAYHTAFTLGFFSTYELDEMGEHTDTYLEAYHSPAGKRCLELWLP